MVEQDTSAEKDEFYRIQMEKFAIQAEETIEAQRNFNIREVGEETCRHEDASGTLVNFFEDRLQNQHVESSSTYSAYEAVEYERQRLQNQESFLSQELLRRDIQH